MSDSTLKLIELINKNYTINQIAEEMNLSHKQLYYRLFLLKNDGFDFKSNYYSNAETKLEMKKFADVFDQDGNTNCTDLITQKGNSSLRTLIISDIHKCNNSENAYCLDKIYDYCIDHNIHIILNCGDLIEGVGSIGGNPTTSDIFEQINSFIHDYPFDENILNFVVLGNHDIHPLNQNGQNFKTILENQRRDIIPIGYKQAILNVKDDRIVMNHHIDNMPNFFQKSTVNLFGHSHKFELKSSVNSLSISVPSLSNINYYKDKFCMPQALDVTFKFSNKYISGIDLIQLLVDEDKPMILSESSVQLNNQRNKNHKDQFLEVDNLPKTKVRIK